LLASTAGMLGAPIAVDIMAAAIILIAITAAITAIATMATITIIGATLITAIAIGKTLSVSSRQLGTRAAAHVAAFFLLSWTRSLRTTETEVS